MTQDSVTTNGQANQRPFIVRLLIALFRLVFWAALIGGVVAGGYYLQTQIDRLNIQMGVQDDRLELLRDDVNTYALAGVPALEREMSAISTTVAMVSQDITSLETAADTQNAGFETSITDLETQSDALATALESVQTDLSAKATEIETLHTDLTAVQELQGTASDDVSTLSTTLDAVMDDTTTLASGLNDLADNLNSLEEMNQSDAALFTTIRVWSLVTQARLSLATEDVPAAQASIKSAQTAVTALLEAGPETVSAVMTAVKDNLDTAANDLGTDEASASDSLEAAWAVLDAAVAETLGYATLEAEIIGQEEEAADEETDNTDEDTDESENEEDAENTDESGEDDEGDEDDG